MSRVHFPRGGTRFHSFASYALPCQTPFSQTAPLLPSVTWQQHVTGYWWEGSTSTAIPPTSTSDVMSQHHKKEALISEQPSYVGNNSANPTKIFTGNPTSVSSGDPA